MIVLKQRGVLWYQEGYRVTKSFPGVVKDGAHRLTAGNHMVGGVFVLTKYALNGVMEGTFSREATWCYLLWEKGRTSQLSVVVRDGNPQVDIEVPYNGILVPLNHAQNGGVGALFSRAGFWRLAFVAKATGLG